MTSETITISSVASPEPRNVTIDSDSNEPTVLHGFGSQHPIAPTSLIDLSLPPNPFNVLATMAVVQADEDYSPQSPEPSIPSPISTPPMNVSTIEGWETTHTTIDNVTLYTDDEPRRVYWDISSTPMSQKMCLSLRALPPPRWLHEDKKETEHKDVFSQKVGSLSARLRGMRPTDAQEKLKYYIISTRL